MSKHINIDNEIRLFKDNIESLQITNIFKNRRINITTALIYYTTIIYIYLLTLSVAFFINPMPYEYFFYGVEMTTNILFLIVLGYRCQDYGIHRYVGIILVVIVSSFIMYSLHGLTSFKPMVLQKLDKKHICSQQAL